MAQKEMKDSEANNVVNNYMLISLAVGVIPIPLVDLVALTGVQLKMLHQLAQIYDVEFEEEQVKFIIAALLGGAVSTDLSFRLGSVMKFIPFIGQTAAGVSVSVLGAAATYAVGKVFIQHFESGGTFLTLDPHKVKDYFSQSLEEAKAEAAIGGVKP